jgi:glucose-1-phosphate thymidylyltransferase
VILARGLGTRMRRDDPAVQLAPEQASAADTGMKGMIPVGGRPLLDYVLSALADAGFREACLVIGPEHGAVREYYTHRVDARRIRVSFALQERPSGTADAVLAAEAFAGGEPFLVINADNYYPAAALAALRERGAPALAGFDAAALGRGGNIPPERIASFAVIDVAPDGSLNRIVEKPEQHTLRAFGGTPSVSMNCWLFTPEIFGACRGVAPSPRGELELPQAVQHLIDGRGARFAVVPVHAPVLDLSSRADIPAVAARLGGVTVRL